MARGRVAQAAFFDLDRTLVPDSAGMHLVAGLVEAGLVDGAERVAAQLFRPLAVLMREAYRRTGESPVSVLFSRRSMKGLAGRSADRLRAAAVHVADRLEHRAFREGRALIAEHRARGHMVVIASSAWRGLVEPLAERLGVDEVVATDYAVEDGRFTGDLVGAWLFGPAKAAAVRELCDDRGIHLSRSYAYSDSWYDRFLLEEVGYPRAVNPDPALRGLAALRGWPVLEFRGAERPRAGLELYDIARPLLHPLALPLDIDHAGIENIPREGPCILAANHRSYADGIVVVALASFRGRKLRFLGKREIFEAPLVGAIAHATGQIPVDRGSGSARPLKAALDALDRGEAVAILPQGTIPRGRAFFTPELHGRPGVARLALASGAPVIPVAVWGTEEVWPRSARLPDPRTIGATVHARVGEPMFLEAPEGSEDDPPTLDRLTREIMAAIQAMLPEAVRNPPSPSPEQVARFSPPQIPLRSELARFTLAAAAAPARAAGRALGALRRAARA